MKNPAGILDKILYCKPDDIAVLSSSLERITLSCDTHYFYFQDQQAHSDTSHPILQHGD